MSALREDVQTAILEALRPVPEMIKGDPDLYIGDVVNAVLSAIQGQLLAEVGAASAAITSLELKIMNDCQPPDMGVVASVTG